MTVAALMAGDWIKMEAATPDKAEVMAITAAMGWDDADLTVGKLFRVWRWFDQQTVDGNAPGVTSALLDRIAGVSGFAEAMALVGWLDVNEAGLTLPNFDRHNGKSAKARALTAIRVKNFKNSNAEGNAPAVTTALPREEKRERREKPVIENAGAQDDFEAAKRVHDKVKASALSDCPPEQMAVAWLKDFGEELIVETLADCEDQYNGKTWRYFEKILVSRRDNPSQRPGQRRARRTDAQNTGRGSGGRSPDSGSAEKAARNQGDPCGKFGTGETTEQVLERLRRAQAERDVPKVQGSAPG